MFPAEPALSTTSAPTSSPPTPARPPRAALARWAEDQPILEGFGTVAEVAERCLRAGPGADPIIRALLEQLISAFRTEATCNGLVERLRRIDGLGRLGQELASVAASKALWEGALGRYLTVAEVAELLGGSSRQAVHQRIARGTLIGMDLGGQTVLPAYQFDGPQLRPEIAQVLRALRAGGTSGAMVISWFATGQPELDGHTPTDWLGKDPSLARRSRPPHRRRPRTLSDRQAPVHRCRNVGTARWCDAGRAQRSDARRQEGLLARRRP